MRHRSRCSLPGRPCSPLLGSSARLALAACARLHSALRSVPCVRLPVRSAPRHELATVAPSETVRRQRDHGTVRHRSHRRPRPFYRPHPPGDRHLAEGPRSRVGTGPPTRPRTRTLVPYRPRSRARLRAPSASQLAAVCRPVPSRSRPSRSPANRRVPPGFRWARAADPLRLPSGPQRPPTGPATTATATASPPVLATGSGRCDAHRSTVGTDRETVPDRTVHRSVCGPYVPRLPGPIRPMERGAVGLSPLCFSASETPGRRPVCGLGGPPGRGAVFRARARKPLPRGFRASPRGAVEALPTSSLPSPVASRVHFGSFTFGRRRFIGCASTPDRPLPHRTRSARRSRSARGSGNYTPFRSVGPREDLRARDRSQPIRLEGGTYPG